MGHRMRHLLPSGVEFMIFAALAVLCAGIVSVFQVNVHDLGLAALGGPIFLVAAVMGLRRSPVWQMDEVDDDVE
jgi:hypothetical protein